MPADTNHARPLSPAAGRRALLDGYRDPVPAAARDGSGAATTRRT